MTDIVERLRDYARNCGGDPEDYLTWQAADEIEKLREEGSVELAKALLEIERLQCELLETHTACAELQERIADLRMDTLR